MCGIAGYIGPDIRRLPASAGRAMAAAIRYRGRDAEGRWSDGRRVFLAHSRLSVIDVAGGGQPMTDTTGRYVLVFNGEIYNYKELRAAYARRGARFRTQSDTEVVVEGYRLLGERVCQDLNGMFALAIWDLEEQQLFLARDRLGKKPLFWFAANGVFAFSSSLDGFQGLPGWTGELSEAGMGLYSLLGTFPGESTVYRQARALPPACHAVVRPGDATLRPCRYWRLAFTPKWSRGKAALFDTYEELLADAIRIRLRSDQPLALTFSGGVDSGSIAVLCARRLHTPLRCFTIDYSTADDPSEETRIAGQVAGLLGLEWRHIQFDYHHCLLPDLPAAYRFYDQPCQQLPLVYAQRLYEAIKPHATVVLSGNGADELFTGYIGDERTRRRGLVLSALRPCRPLFRARVFPEFLRLPLPDAFFASLERQAASLVPAGEALEEVRAHLRALLAEARESGAEAALDLKMFMGLFCSAVDSNFRLPDISGLAAQVEVRSPYLDYRMVEFAARLAHRLKVGSLFSPRRNKLLPKQWYARHVPREIAWSRKKGMGWNLRWDRSIATDPGYHAWFARAYDALDEAGIASAPYRQAWSGYVRAIRRGVEFPAEAGMMMKGFMLGMWLLRKREEDGRA